MPGELFDLPEYRRAVDRFVRDPINALANTKDPVLAQLQRVRVEVLPRTRMSLPDTEQVLDTAPFQTESTFTFDAGDALDGDFDTILAGLDEAANQLVHSVMPQIFDQISRVSDAVGNTIDAQGQGFSWDLWLQGLATVEIPFDDDGNPRLPQLILNPQTAAAIPEMTPAQHAALGELIENKREEWDARRRHRRLSRRPRGA